ncbi:MAG: biopolymer transporter ExbD [Anaeromyxobacter sp.]
MSMDVGSKNVKSDINVTPLVDVVLVLLIIFMVITPMLQRGKPVQLPDAKHVSALKSGGDPVMVSMTKDGKISDRQVRGREGRAGGAAAGRDGHAPRLARAGEGRPRGEVQGHPRAHLRDSRRPT